MKKKLIELLGLAADATDEQVIAAVAALKESCDKAMAADAQRRKDESVIAEKIRHGLTREQAIAVIQRQREHDQREAAAAAAKAAKAEKTESTDKEAK